MDDIGNITKLSVTVPWDATQVRVTATPFFENATVAAPDGTPLKATEFALAYSLAHTDGEAVEVLVNLTVTAEDGVSRAVYPLLVSRPPSPPRCEIRRERCESPPGGCELNKSI